MKDRDILPDRAGLIRTQRRGRRRSRILFHAGLGYQDLQSTRQIFLRPMTSR